MVTNAQLPAAPISSGADRQRYSPA